MTKKEFELINGDDKARQASIYTRMYIVKALDVYCWNEKVSRSEIVNKLLEDFLIQNGYMSKEGDVLRERIF